MAAVGAAAGSSAAASTAPQRASRRRSEPVKADAAAALARIASTPGATTRRALTDSYVDAALGRALEAAGRVRDRVLAEQVSMCGTCTGAGRLLVPVWAPGTDAGVRRVIQPCLACRGEGVR